MPPSKLYITDSKICNMEFGEQRIFSISIAESNFRKHLNQLGKLHNCYYEKVTLNEGNQFRITKFKREPIPLKWYKYRISVPRIRINGYEFLLKKR